MTRVTELPETVHTAKVVEVKPTLSVELAVALSETGPLVREVSEGCVKVIVCAPLVTVKLFVAVGAAL